MSQDANNVTVRYIPVDAVLAMRLAAMKLPITVELLLEPAADSVAADVGVTIRCSLVFGEERVECLLFDPHDPFVPVRKPEPE